MKYVFEVRPSKAREGEKTPYRPNRFFVTKDSARAYGEEMLDKTYDRYEIHAYKVTSNSQKELFVLALNDNSDWFETKFLEEVKERKRHAE